MKLFLKVPDKLRSQDVHHLKTSTLIKDSPLVITPREDPAQEAIKIAKNTIGVFIVNQKFS